VAAGTTSTVTALIGGAALTQGSSIMACDAESRRCSSSYLLGIGSLIVITVIITNIIGVVALRGMGGDVIIQLELHTEISRGNVSIN
jgi:hypothetical protein